MIWHRKCRRLRIMAPHESKKFYKQFLSFYNEFKNKGERWGVQLNRQFKGKNPIFLYIFSSTYWTVSFSQKLRLFLILSTEVERVLERECSLINFNLAVWTLVSAVWHRLQHIHVVHHNLLQKYNFTHEIHLF